MSNPNHDREFFLTKLNFNLFFQFIQPINTSLRCYRFITLGYL